MIQDFFQFAMRKQEVCIKGNDFEIDWCYSNQVHPYSNIEGYGVVLIGFIYITNKQLNQYKPNLQDVSSSISTCIFKISEFL